MKLKREPGDACQTFSLQLFDPDRVDVAPGSNVVREDHQIDREVAGHLIEKTFSILSGFPLATFNYAVAQWNCSG